MLVNLSFFFFLMFNKLGVLLLMHYLGQFRRNLEILRIYYHCKLPSFKICKSWHLGGGEFFFFFFFNIDGSRPIGCIYNFPLKIFEEGFHKNMNLLVTQMQVYSSTVHLFCYFLHFA